MSTDPYQSGAYDSLTEPPSTPQRADTCTRASLADVTPIAKHSAFGELRFQPRTDSAAALEPSSHGPTTASRRRFGIPTPPYSETTSSASGSDGRSRKDSHETSFTTDRSAFDRIDPSSQRLQPSIASHTASASSRSPSAASSSNNTGSDTVGARSPIQPQDSHFKPSTIILTSGSTMKTETGAPGPSSSSRGGNTGASPLPESASPSAPHTSSSPIMHSNSHSQRRKRRSEMHERDVSQIRSESRLGMGSHDDDEAADEQDNVDHRHPFPRVSKHKYSPRKSTTLSLTSQHYDESESVNSDQQSPSQRASQRASQRTSLDGPNTNLPLTPASAKTSRYTGGDQLPSGSMRRLSKTTGRTSARHSSDDRTSPRIMSASRSPMPAEFRLPDKEIRRAYRAAHQQKSSDPDDSDGSEGREQLIPAGNSSELGDSTAVHSPVSHHRDSLDEIQEENAKDSPTHPSTQHPRRRYASDAAADEGAARLNYEGRLGTQGSRISVDSSSAQRYLSKSSQQSTPSTSARRTPRSSEAYSPSEESRSRKISSTSSGRSQKSSSSVSELHRAASRASMRKQYGSDLFSVEPRLPATTIAAPRPHSPSVRTEYSSSLTNSSDRSRPYNNQHRRIDAETLDNLRNQVEDLHVGRTSSEHDRRHLPPVSLRTHAQPGATRSSLDLKPSALGSVRAQSVMGLQRTPNDGIRTQHVHQYPSTDPQRSRYDRSWPTTDPNNSSDAVNRIHELASLRSGISRRQSVSQRSTTAMGTAPENVVASPIQDTRILPNGEEPAPIRNLAIRLSQYEALYSKVPSADETTSAVTGPHTARTVELMGAIVRSTSTIWAELSLLHPVATEARLTGRQGDPFTEAFGQLDEGLAFVNKLVLEQARAMQDLLFLLDRTEKERQAQFNHALVEMGHSPRPFSRIGSGTAAFAPGESKFANGGESSASADRHAHLLRRATSSVRKGSSLQIDSPSPFSRPLRGNGSAERGGTLTASQIRSMSSLGHSSNHARSASELSPSSSAAQRRLDRVALQLPREASQDSPLSSRRRVVGRPFPSGDATQVAASSCVGSVPGAAMSRPPPAFTPRRPRLSNPSVSNATASFQPSAASTASSVVAPSPDDSIRNGMSGVENVESEGSTIGGQHGVASEVDEFGRVIEGGEEEVLVSGDTVRPSRRRRVRGNASLRGGPRVVDTLVSQLDTLKNVNDQVESQQASVEEADHVGAMGEGHTVQRRHAINLHRVTSPSSIVDHDPNRSPPKLSQYGLSKSSNPPPRPPRHIQRPSEETISSLRGNQGRTDPSTPTSGMVEDGGTPRQTNHRRGSIQDDNSQVDGGLGYGASSMVKSLGRTAARRVSRVLGSSQS